MVNLLIVTRIITLGDYLQEFHDFSVIHRAIPCTTGGVHRRSFVLFTEKICKSVEKHEWQPPINPGLVFVTRVRSFDLRGRNKVGKSENQLRPPIIFTTSLFVHFFIGCFSFIFVSRKWMGGYNMTRRSNYVGHIIFDQIIPVKTDSSPHDWSNS